MSGRLPAAVVDTTLLSRLRDLEIVELLPWVFSEVLIPAEVRAEIGKRPGRLRRWLSRLLEQQGDFFKRCTREDRLVRLYLDADLDPGEAAVIAQAYETASVAVVDERAGRRRAQDMDITVVPTGAVLVGLKDAGAIPLVAPYLDRLGDLGFHLGADVRDELLALAKEA